MNQPEKNVRQLWNAILDLQTMVYGRSSSVTRGRFRFAGNESLLVQGSQKVEGWLVVTGTERVTGTLEVQGRLIASGAIGLTGPTSITGSTTIAGDVSLKGTMAVDGGEIQVKGGDSPATLRDGAMSFATGGKVEADAASGGVRLAAGSGNKVYVGDGIVAVQLAGGGTLTITEGGTTINDPNGVTVSSDLRVTGATTVDRTDTVTGVESNAYIDPATGRIQRIL
ncbi:hypothetical protein [Microbacterium oleivorans]|uniref:Uncharacterized protein n=1 Tax=Microbacterium oleivorans TaxID=273677 RepID=A0A7D5IS94_9MICO|nr:hypothetical protein [Microbacterium oleivorans]QLD11377.1 hypothetical protein HW566_06065 [Microbacterium oleivorans]